MGSTAKAFMTGRSQAVRLPKEFRFESDETRIRSELGRVDDPEFEDWPE